MPVGSIPTAMTIFLSGENTRKVMPGDSVTISGVLVPLLRTGFRQMVGGLVTEVFLDAHVKYLKLNKIIIYKKNFLAC